MVEAGTGDWGCFRRWRRRGRRGKCRLRRLLRVRGVIVSACFRCGEPRFLTEVIRSLCLGPGSVLTALRRAWKRGGWRGGWVSGRLTCLVVGRGATGGSGGGVFLADLSGVVRIRLLLGVDEVGRVELFLAEELSRPGELEKGLRQLFVGGVYAVLERVVLEEKRRKGHGG